VLSTPERDISVQVFKKGLLLRFVLGLIVRVAFLLEHARTPSFTVPFRQRLSGPIGGALFAPVPLYFESAFWRTNEALQAYERGKACTPPSKNAFIGSALAQIRLGLVSALGVLNKLTAGHDPAAPAISSVLARREGDIAKADALEQAARQLDPRTASWAMQRAGEN
jgi:hypothetical protein